MVVTQPDPTQAAASRPAEHVVVVDDQDDVATSVALALALDGFEVHTARDGASALEAVQRYAPICVVTNVNMPGIDGFELARRLRVRYGGDIVVIAVTGWGVREDDVSPDYADFDHCLRKPLDLDRLRRILRPH